MRSLGCGSLSEICDQFESMLGFPIVCHLSVPLQARWYILLSESGSWFCHISCVGLSDSRSLCHEEGAGPNLTGGLQNVSGGVMISQDMEEVNFVRLHHETGALVTRRANKIRLEILLFLRNYEL